ncbi:polymorphic toxin type 15 domain-containing protein [Deinococcus knuensis]|uniref:Novel toxin 15 domain-containing protein n=1 Tax=Deinococcus knuensis TaxID=1837380 RepID=A0ABQ2SM31_9DEIO|nr:hypothetical protein GCM10008961_23860 [Deinococcus knuensis]
MTGNSEIPQTNVWLKPFGRQALGPVDVYKSMLHSLDQVGGGSATVFPGSGLDAYGVTRINSSTGAGWKALVRKIEDHVRPYVSHSNYATVSMSPITVDVRQG